MTHGTYFRVIVVGICLQHVSCLFIYRWGKKKRPVIHVFLKRYDLQPLHSLSVGIGDGI